MICEQCGGDRVFSYPPPAYGCPVCGAPVCCRTCCDARSPGYNREDDLPESPSSPAIPKMQAFAPMEEMARLRRERDESRRLLDEARAQSKVLQSRLDAAVAETIRLASMLPGASGMHLNAAPVPAQPVAPEAVAKPSGCPKCGEPEIDAMTPLTVYACESSDLDQRPGTFHQSKTCAAILSATDTEVKK